MIQILRLLKGYVEFCAEGGFPERFINLCNMNGINLWNVKNDGVKVFGFTTEREFKELKIPAEKSGMTLKCVKSRGLKNFMKRHKWRCGAFLGIALAFCFWFFMSGFIWEIEILATEGVKVEDFTESLENAGVKIGARKSDIDIIQVQNQLMNEYSELLWVSLNIFGGKVQVEMSEFVEQKDITDTQKPVNVVAKKKGKIVLVKGYRGVSVIKEGDNVSPGSLLISGVVKNFDGSEYFTHARGEVFARTQNIEKVICRYKKKVSTTVQKENRFYLYIFSLKMPLTVKTKGDFLTESNKFLKSGDTVLPFGIVREDDISKIQKNVEYSHEEAKLCALLSGVRMKRGKFNKSDLKSVKYEVTDNKNGAVIKLKVDCVEDIAKESPIFTEN